MIVWLNGTFGAGKTTTAGRLVPLLHDARLFDPELVGYLLTACLTDRPVDDCCIPALAGTPHPARRPAKIAG